MAEPLSCQQIAAAVQAHERSARDFADTALAAAEKHQAAYRAFIKITPVAARKQAERVDRLVGMGKKLPLAGVPFAVKDLFDMQGEATTCGSKAFADRVAKADAEAVKRLLAAGAVPIGKLNMHECAFGFTGENPTYGDCKNPWNPERIPGGSSSGSAVAVALGICPLTLGSDTGGSIRMPSALCSVTGLKPTYGRVSRAGCAPLSWSMDHVGPLTRTAEEAALVLQILAGEDPADETTLAIPVPDYAAELKRPLAGLRLGVPKNWFFTDLQPAVEKAVRAAIEELVKLGAKPVVFELSHLEEVVGAHRAIIFSEASEYHLPFLRERGDLYAPDIRPLLLAGLFLPAVDYLHAQRVRRVVRKAWAETLTAVDCFVTPTTPVLATKFGQQDAELPKGRKPLVRAYLDLTLPFNFSGHPAVSAPCGFSEDGLPIGMQIVGKPFEEATILRVAHQYQQATDWHTRVPKV